MTLIEIATKLWVGPESPLSVGHWRLQGQLSRFEGQKTRPHQTGSVGNDKHFDCDHRSARYKSEPS